MNIPQESDCSNKCEETFNSFVALLNPSSIQDAIGQAGATLDQCCTVHSIESMVQFGEKFPVDFRQFVVPRFNKKYKSETVDRALSALVSKRKLLVSEKEIVDILDEGDSILYLLFWQTINLGAVNRDWTASMIIELESLSS